LIFGFANLEMAALFAKLCGHVLSSSFAAGSVPSPVSVGFGIE